MAKNITEVMLNSDTVFVSIRSKGAIRTLPLSANVAKSARLKEPALVIYEDAMLQDQIVAAKKVLMEMSSSAMLTAPSNSTFAIPVGKIAELKAKLDAIDNQVDADLSYIEAHYDEIKKANMSEVDKAIAHMDETERKKVKARAEVRYPSIVEIKSKRQLLFSILASPLAKNIPDIEMLAERINDDAQARYKESVFVALDPIYKALATYYTKLSNGRDIGQKSKNFFDGLVAEIKEGNQIRRDGFTENVIKVLEKYGDSIFEDAMTCYTIMLNIYNEAYACGVEGTLTDLEKMERRLLKDVPSASFLLEADMIDEDAESATPIADLM